MTPSRSNQFIRSNQQRRTSESASTPKIRTCRAKFMYAASVADELAGRRLLPSIRRRSMPVFLTPAFRPRSMERANAPIDLSATMREVVNDEVGLSEVAITRTSARCAAITRTAVSSIARASAGGNPAFTGLDRFARVIQIEPTRAYSHRCGRSMTIGATSSQESRAEKSRGSARRALPANHVRRC